MASEIFPESGSGESVEGFPSENQSLNVQCSNKSPNEKMQISPVKTESHPFGQQMYLLIEWNPETTGVFPRNQGQHLVKCSKNIYMPLRVMSVCGTLTSYQWLESRRCPIHHFIDIHVGGGGWGHSSLGQRSAYNVFQSVHLGPGDPELLGCRVWSIWITH